MTNLEQEMIDIQEKALDEIKSISDEKSFNEIHLKYMGRKGIISCFISKLRTLLAIEKPAVGKTFNSVKATIQNAFDERLGQLKQKNDEQNALDISLPSRKPEIGHKHPVMKVMDDAVAIFRRMGFIVADGPDIDTVWDNFDALNAPKDHPSRSPEDQFYFNLDKCDYLDRNTLLLRSQTSDVQIRTMMSQEPPIRIICAGRCYRRDTPDATHGMSFHQIEGLYVDEHVSLADLKGVFASFARDMFGGKTEIRFRPHHFPFTEPSVEADASCMVCGGKGCNVCKGSGWIEIGGAGIVNPAVFQNVGYEPESVSGFAFGLGIERLAMIRYGISDLRLLYDNDARFLHQF